MALFAFVLAFSCISFTQEVESATLHGTVRDPQGKPVEDAAVEMRSSDSKQQKAVHTDSHGFFSIVGLRQGVYDLRVTKAGYADGGISSVFLGPKEEKTLQLMLGIGGTAESVLGNPKFSDETQFTVSGVTDPSNLGGHGSDTVVRTREALAADTVSLGKTSGETQPSGSAPDKSLQESASAIRSQLAQHDQPELHRQLAEVEEKLGDPLEAARQYQRAAEMDPSENNLFNWAADVLLHHAPEPAMQIFSRGNALFPRSERMLLGLGAASFALGVHEQAIQQICQASDLNPSDPIPYHFLGRIELSETRPSHDALERLRRFVMLQPSSPEANYYYAAALWKESKGAQLSGVDSQAEKLLENTLALDPKFAAAELQLGIIHSEQAKYAEAVSDYMQAIRLDPKMEEAHYRLAQAYRQLGKTEQAQEELRLYEQLLKESAQEAERRRREIRQLVYTLRTADH